MFVNLLKTKGNGKVWHRTIHQTSNCYKTHYEVLKVPQNSTTKEIKESYIKLSKQYHPDLQTAKSSQKEFVKIVEAYNVLSKPESRRTYDLGLPLSKLKDYKAKTESYNDEEHIKNPYDDPSFHKNRDRSKDHFYERQPYYGIKGIKKVSNGSIVGICVLAALVAVVMQILAIRYSITLKRDEMLRQSDENEAILSNIRNTANLNGNDLQIEILKEKMRRDKYIQYKD